MPKHEEKSPSSAYRWTADRCPGSIEESRFYKDRGSVYSKAGDAAHEEAARCLRRGCFSTCESYGKRVNTFLRYIYGLDEKYASRPDLERVETKMMSIDIAKFGGTMDWLGIYQIRDYTIAHVVDYKNGFQDVEVVGNRQGLSYCLIVSENFPGIDEFHFTIVQPDNFNPIQTVEFSRGDLAEFRELVVDAEGDDTLRFGHWCEYCPAIAGCPEYDRGVVAEAMQGFTQKDNRDRYRQVLKAEKTIKKYFDQVKQHIKTDLENGYRDPEYKLVQGEGNRTFKTEDVGELARILTARGVKEDSLWNDRKMRTPTQIAADGYGAIIEDLVERKKKNLLLVSKDDHRDAVRYNRPFE